MKYKECEDCQYCCPPDKPSICEEEDREEYLKQEQERMACCTCGAYRWTDKKGFVQIADCCCGRT